MLTKKQKYEAYKRCLIDIESEVRMYCCVSFMVNGFIDSKTKDCKILFPELYNLRNKETMFWFESRNERIKALKKCIELTK